MSIDYPQMPLKMSLCPGLRLWEIQGWVGKEGSGCNIPRLKSICSELPPPPPTKGKGCEQYQKAFLNGCEGKQVVKKMKGIRKEMESTASLLLWILNFFFLIPTSLPLLIFTGPGWIFPFQADVIPGLQVSQYPVCCCCWLLQTLTHSLWSERASFLPVFAAVWKVMPGKRNSTYHLSYLYDVRVSSFLLLTHLL